MSHVNECTRSSKSFKQGMRLHRLLMETKDIHEPHIPLFFFCFLRRSIQALNMNNKRMHHPAIQTIKGGMQHELQK